MQKNYAMSTLLTIPSGQSINFTVTLLDEKGVAISNENTATARITINTLHQYEKMMKRKEGGEKGGPPKRIL